ncbi:hypothetical protein [Nocardia xishanensis]
MRVTGRWLPTIGTGSLSAAAGVAAAALLWQRVYPLAVIAALSAVLTAVISSSLIRRRRGDQVALGDIADRLAVPIGTELDETAPLPVRLFGQPPGDRADRLVAIEPDDTVEDIDAVFARATEQRLVLLGPPGSGKTFASARLARRLLSVRTPGTVVPVLLDMCSWDPAEQALPEWIAVQLTVGHVAFAGWDAGDARRAARALVDEGFILPILDGLDGIAAALRPRAIDQIATALAPGVPLVLTCCAEEYAAMGEPAQLSAATVRYLQPLDLASVTEHLRVTGGNAQSQRRWRPVFEHMTADSDGPVATALRTPLTLTLARTYYNPPAETSFDTALPDPDELRHADRFLDRAAIEDHLLEAFIPAVYRSAGERDDRRIARANRSLVALARELDRRGSRDIAWWELWLAISDPHKYDRWVVGVLTALAVLPFERWQFALLTGAISFFTFVFASRVVPHALLDGLPRRIALRPPAWASFVRNVPIAISSAAFICVYVGLFWDWRTGLIAGAAMGFANWWAGPLRAAFGFDETADIRAIPPRRAVVQDRWFTLVQTSEATISGTLAGYAMYALPGYGLPLGIAIGAISLLRGAWGRFVMARLWWRVNYATPLRMLAFLAQAERNGVLVRVGPVYRFRHIAVQRRLAGSSRSDANDASATAVPQPAASVGRSATAAEPPEPTQTGPEPSKRPDNASARPITQLRGGITKLATTPDNQFLVTAGIGRAALVWDLHDLAAPAVVAVTHSHWDEALPVIRSFAIQANGNLLATGAADGMIGLFSFDTPAYPQPIAGLHAHSKDVAGLDFHPSAPLLAAAGGDHTATLWDASNPSSPELTATLRAHRRPVRSVRFSPDGAWLVTGGRDGVACLWDIRRPAQPILRHRISGDVGWIFVTAIHPSGSVLAISGRFSRYTLWSMPEIGPPLRHARIRRYGYTAAFSADGALLATGHRKGIGLWNPADLGNPKLIAHLPSPFPVTAVAFHPLEDAVIGGGIDGSVAVWKFEEVIPAVPDTASSDNFPG